MGSSLLITTVALVSNMALCSRATGVGDSSTATRVGDSSTATRVGDSTTATGVGDSSTATGVGDSSTATRVGDRECAGFCDWLEKSSCRYDERLIHQAALKGLNKNTIIKGTIPSKLEDCSKQVHLSSSNEGGLRCKTSTKPCTQDKYQSIFIVCSDTNVNPKMLDLDSLVSTVFPIVEGAVTSAVFISTRREFLIATYTTRLFWLSLDGRDRKSSPIRKSFGYSCMVYDKHKKLIFLVSGTRKFSARMLSDKGAHMYHSYLRGCRPLDVALDIKHSFMYFVCGNKGLKKYSYRFDFISRMKKRVGKLRHIFFDEPNNCLYLLTKQWAGDQLQRIDPLSYKAKNITILKMRIIRFMVSGHLLYFGANREKITILNISNTEETQRVKTFDLKDHLVHLIFK